MRHQRRRPITPSDPLGSEPKGRHVPPIRSRRGTRRVRGIDTEAITEIEPAPPVCGAYHSVLTDPSLVPDAGVQHDLDRGQEAGDPLQRHSVPSRSPSSCRANGETDSFVRR